MDRENGRTFSRIRDDTKHLYHDHSYSGLGTEIKHFKTHPYHDHTYSKFHHHRSRFSGNYKSIKPRSNEYRSPNITSAEPKSDKQFLAYCGSFKHSSVKKRSPSHVAVELGTSDYRSAEYRLTDHGTTEYSSVKQRSSGHVAVEHGPTNYRSGEYRLTDHGTTEHISVDIHSSANHRTANHSSAKFPSQDDVTKCLLMKVYQVIEPKLKKLLLFIFKDKQDSETLEIYAKKHGMDFKWQKHFSEEQIKNIQQNPDFDGFDSTLIFRCIEVLKDFNPTLIKDENCKFHIDDTMKKIKSTRNLLCHNRKNLTDTQCRDKAKSLKNPLEDLLELINKWNREMDITTEKRKIWEEVEAVMNGGLNEEEFRYMCLLKVINCVIESSLHKVTQLICYDKEEKENFREYFKGKGMNTKTYKDTFFKEEKYILESNSKEVQPDLTLHCKIIEACTKWYPSLKDNENVKKELSNILKQIRGIRNHVTHNMLSISLKECNVKAQELGDSLKDLVDLINFIQNKKSDITMREAKMNFNQIMSDINLIMSVPYTFP